MQDIASLYMAFRLLFSFVAILAANSDYLLQVWESSQRLFQCFQAFAHCGTAIWIGCAVQLGSVQAPYSWKGHLFRSAALHRIQFRTRGFIPMPYFYSETNECSKGWAKQWWVLFWSVTSFRNPVTRMNFAKNIKKFISHGKKSVVTAQNLQLIKIFLTLQLCKSVLHEWQSLFFLNSSKPVAAPATASN